MTRRMLTALLALLGLFLSTYLLLYKAGLIGTLACGTGGCETVQLSKWATFLGVPTAAWGIAYYALVFGLEFAGVQDRWAESRRLPVAVLVVTACGVLFSAWLTYVELWVIHAICRWCVVSAVLAVLLFALAFSDWRSSTGTSDSLPPA